MLEQVRREHAAEVVDGQVDPADVADDDRDGRVAARLGEVDRVDEPALLGVDRMDELAPARGRVEHPRRPAHHAVDVGPDLAPRGFARRLADAAVPVSVQPLVIEVTAALRR